MNICSRLKPHATDTEEVSSINNFFVLHQALSGRSCEHESCTSGHIYCKGNFRIDSEDTEGKFQMIILKGL
jgi:hypothetical protein